MLDRRKKMLIGTAVAALLSITLLAGGLGTVELRDGDFFQIQNNSDLLGSELLNKLFGPDMSGFFQILGYLMIVFVPIGFVMALISAEWRRQILQYFKILVPLIALFYLFSQLKNVMNNNSLELAPPNENKFPEGEIIDPIGIAASPPEWIVYLISILFLLALVGGGWWVYVRFFRPSTLEQLGLDAQDALDDLASGADLNDTILRCYVDMTTALRRQRGIKRKQAMTAREFEVRLSAAGLPGTQIRQLTRLFESVRYGGNSPSASQEQEAMECLQAIVKEASFSISVNPSGKVA